MGLLEQAIKLRVIWQFFDDNWIIHNNVHIRAAFSCDKPSIRRLTSTLSGQAVASY
jgi:hypothetical protein